MNRILTIAFFLIAVQINNGQDSHSLFTNILNKHVSDGKVDYKGLLSEKSIENYLNFQPKK